MRRKLPHLTASALHELLIIRVPPSPGLRVLVERAKELGIIDNFRALLARAGYPPTVQTPAMNRWVQASEQAIDGLQQRAQEGDSDARALIWGAVDMVSPQLEAFCAQYFITTEVDRLNPEGREDRGQVFDKLLERGVPPDIIRRVQELCILAGFLVSACHEVDQYYRKVREQLIPMKRHYIARKRQIVADRGLSGEAKARVREEIDILLALLETHILEKQAVATWRRWLGVDKRSTLAQQKQRIWSLAFTEVLKLIRPFCAGKSWDAYSQIMPEEAYRQASRLMHLFYPTLWPDRPDLVKRRYHDSR
jgi:hypothetical protein